MELQKQLGAVDSTKAATLRKERNVTFKQIDELQAKKIAILSIMKAKSKSVRRYISKGMTSEEVLSLIGKPRSKVGCCGRECWNYGDVWIRFNDNLVDCAIASHSYENCKKCSDFYNHQKIQLNR